MKRYGYLYEKICDIENIKLAIVKASKKKTKRRDVRRILNNIDYYALEIQEMLISQQYKPSPYKVTKIYDGANNKERIIHKPNFYPDQIIHWSLMLVLESILIKGMYAHSCGSIPGKGSSWGHKYIEKWIRNDKKKLHRAKKEIEKLLSEMKLNIKGNWQVFRVDDRGVDFLGLRFFRKKTILRKRNALRIKRRAKKITKKQRLNSKDAAAIISYWGWIKRSDSYNFYNMHIRKHIKINEARRAISENSKYSNAYKGSRNREKEKWNVRCNTNHKCARKRN